MPLRIAGKRLEVNARTGGKGAVRVELLDPAGRPLDGYRLSEPLADDSLRHAVTFPGRADPAGLAGKPICLRFHLRDAQLFAIAFRD